MGPWGVLLILSRPITVVRSSNGKHRACAGSAAPHFLSLRRTFVQVHKRLRRPARAVCSDLVLKGFLDAYDLLDA